MTDSGSPGQKSIEIFGQQMDRIGSSTLQFWMHLTLLEATVLGLTVGLLQASSHRPGPLLIWSWALLLVSIAIGCVLVKVWLDVSFDRSLRSFRFAFDMSVIQSRVEEKQIVPSSEQHVGLFAAATQVLTGDTASPLSEQGRTLAATYSSQLPSSFITVPERRGIESFLHRRWQLLASTYYALSGIAFALLLLSIALPERTIARSLESGTQRAQMRAGEQEDSLRDVIPAGVLAMDSTGAAGSDAEAPSPGSTSEIPHGPGVASDDSSEATGPDSSDTRSSDSN